VSGRGQFIVIEGTDGAGKATQTARLAKRLKAAGHDVAVFDFPRYGQPSAYFVEQYLNGGFGELASVNAYQGSLFYALDRYAAGFAIRKALADGKIVLANRYVGSNLAHQGGKFDDAGERQEYFRWNERLEFEQLGIPRPDLNLVLHVPAAVAQQLVDHKGARDYTDKTRDLHEADLDHLQRAERAYLEICELFPQTFTRIECATGGAIDSVEAIGERIWAAVEPQLTD
jgi:dTMP kinase